MKKLLFVLLLSLSVTASFAQEELKFSSGRDKHDGKPQLFAGLSQKISVKAGFIDEVMNSKMNEEVTLQVVEGFAFTGKVISKSSDVPGLETVTVENSSRKGFVLTLSKITTPVDGVTYRGMLKGRDFSDILLLEKDIVTGFYQWIKKKLSQAISD
ncbi:MAG: hypothetical protein K2X48_02900 [Chitinophagaceae bacterium]|nr:hypothetical protein [Chitinophagaceae bacterium]